MHGIDTTWLWFILLAPLILLVICGLIVAYGLYRCN